MIWCCRTGGWWQSRSDKNCRSLPSLWRFLWNDPKDSKDFKYLLFTECPKFTPAHKSFMAKFLTPEVGETRYIVTCRLVLCCVKSCRVVSYCVVFCEVMFLWRFVRIYMLLSVRFSLITWRIRITTPMYSCCYPMKQAFPSLLCSALLYSSLLSSSLLCSALLCSSHSFSSHLFSTIIQLFFPHIVMSEAVDISAHLNLYL